VKRILIVLVVGLGLQAFAGVSLLTGAILIGGDKVYDFSLEWTLDRSIQKVASLIGEACTLTEHFYYEGGLGYARASFVIDELKRNKWVLKELIPYGPSSSGRLGVWYMVRGRERVLAVLYEFSDGSGGVVSFCRL
jgi:hypothetical protein